MLLGRNKKQCKYGLCGKSPTESIWFWKAFVFPFILKGHLRYLSKLCRLRVIYKLGWWLWSFFWMFAPIALMTQTLVIWSPKIQSGYSANSWKSFCMRNSLGFGSSSTRSPLSVQTQKGRRFNFKGYGKRVTFVQIHSTLRWIIAVLYNIFFWSIISWHGCNKRKIREFSLILDNSLVLYEYKCLLTSLIVLFLQKVYYS